MVIINPNHIAAATAKHGQPMFSVLKVDYSSVVRILKGWKKGSGV
jgi:hypothetical protein